MRDREKILQMGDGEDDEEREMEKIMGKAEQMVAARRRLFGAVGKATRRRGSEAARQRGSKAMKRRGVEALGFGGSMRIRRGR
ncbi:hypothetical protein ACLOJK_022075 [Asimina triloba]